MLARVGRRVLAVSRSGHRPLLRRAQSSTGGVRAASTRLIASPLAFAGGAGLITAATHCSSSPPPAAADEGTAASWVKTASGLRYTDHSVGTGAQPVPTYNK